MAKYNLGDSVYYVEMRSGAAALLEDKYRIIDLLDGGENFLLIRDFDMINAAEYPKSNDGDYWDNEYQVIKASRSNIMYEDEVSKLAELIIGITLYDYDKDRKEGYSQFINMVYDESPDNLEDVIKEVEGFMLDKIHDGKKYNNYSGSSVKELSLSFIDKFKTIQEFNTWIVNAFGNGSGFFTKVNDIYYLNMDNKD